MNSVSTMGSRIKEMRLKRGVTQEQLAELLYTKKVTISAYENNRIDIKSSVVMELAKALNCTVSYLIEGEQSDAGCEELIKIFQSIKSEKLRKVSIEQMRLLVNI